MTQSLGQTNLQLSEQQKEGQAPNFKCKDTTTERAGTSRDTKHMKVAPALEM